MLIKAFVWKPMLLSFAQTLHDFPALSQECPTFLVKITAVILG